MVTRSVFVPFMNFSPNAGKLNPAGLIAAEGVLHGGQSYVPIPPLVVPTETDFEGIAEDVDPPILAHVNSAVREDNDGDFSIFLYAGGEMFRVHGELDALDWSIESCGDVTTPLEEDEGDLLSFGKSEILAAGLENPVQIFEDEGTEFEDCFTSVDKPKAKYAAILGQRVIFGHIADTGTADVPDPNRSLVWWGGTNKPRLIGNQLSLPKLNTAFLPLDDQYGDISGIIGGRADAVILKHRSVTLLRLGGIFGVETERLAAGVGTRHSRSRVELGEDRYFWSTLGPAVVRNGEFFLLGDGVFALRALFEEGPSNPEFAVLGAVADVESAIVGWLVRYKSFAYTYSETGREKTPVETPSEAVTTYAFLTYNVASDQLAFAWRAQDEDGLGIIDESDPETPHKFIPLALVDLIPWRNPLPLAGIGLLAVESAATDEAGPRYPRLFLTGFADSTYTPEWIVNQTLKLETGFIPFDVQNAYISGVRPILRSRRAVRLPEIVLRIKTLLTPWGTERQHGPWNVRENTDPLRRGTIATNGVSGAGYASFSLEVDPRYSIVEDEEEIAAAYAFMLSEIEGFEIEFNDGGQK